MFSFIIVAFFHFYPSLAQGPEQGPAPHELDMALYHETFSATFRDKLDVTSWGPSKWIAHTPWNSDFGDARFADPKPGFPFLTGADGLQIIARKNADGKWESGLLSSVDAEDRGFAQAGGYFEARMKLPPWARRMAGILVGRTRK